MKSLILIALVFIGINANAQLDLLGKNEIYITRHIVNTNNYIFQSRNIKTKGADSVITLEYHPKDSDTTGLMPVTFFIKNDTCKLFTISSFLSDLPNTISSLNKHYQRIDDNDWIDKSNTFEATLWKDESGFYISFKKM